MTKNIFRPKGKSKKKFKLRLKKSSAKKKKLQSSSEESEAEASEPEDESGTGLILSNFPYFLTYVPWSAGNIKGVLGPGDSGFIIAVVVILSHEKDEDFGSD